MKKFLHILFFWIFVLSAGALRHCTNISLSDFGVDTLNIEYLSPTDFPDKGTSN